MAIFNHTTRELTAKIVYYGPALGGKTTNLRTLHEKLDQAARGKLLSLATAQDRTIYFDLLPVELGNIKGYTVRFQLCTVPGQVFYNETRKIVLRGVDGIVFVVDSQPAMLSHDLESFQNLRENLRAEKIALESLPVVIQYNKRDLPSSLTVAALQESLGFSAYPFVEAAATEGAGVVETFRLASKLTFVDLLRRLQRGDPGVHETAAAALVAATETAPALASDAPEQVFAHTEPEPVPVAVVAEHAAAASEPPPASPGDLPSMMFEGLSLDEDSEGWESATDDTGPRFDDEPSLDSTLVTSELPVEADLATTRAIEAPAVPQLLTLVEEPPAPAPETAEEATEAAEAVTPDEPSEPPVPSEPAELSPPPPPPFPAVEAVREETEARVSARLTALEEEIAALRSALAESRSREDSLLARTEELGRRWDALRKLLAEDGPAAS